MSAAVSVLCLDTGKQSFSRVFQERLNQRQGLEVLTPVASR